MTLRRDRDKRYRDKRKAKGKCERCEQPAFGKSRCADCARKKAETQLPAWVEAQMALRVYVSCERLDRKHNGKHTRGLDWALIMHNSTAKVEDWDDN